MKKYEIGIQTFWNVPNYGTFAQAYALQRVLQKMNPGQTVYQIAHLDKKHYDFYFNRKAYFRRFPVWKKAFWKSFFLTDQTSTKKAEVFLKAYDMIPHTEEITAENADRYCFDKVFLGSDIVWDYSIRAFDKDPMLFGVGLQGEINSYGASFGTVRPNDVFPSYVKDAIKAIRHISVRDTNSAEIVQRITGKYPEVVLDPTWLWDFETDENVVKPNENNYVLVYGQDFTDQFISNLIDYAKRNHRSLIALDCNNDSYQWCDRLIGQSELTPFQWIGYFRFADAVATSTFHGITFGLMFHKPLAFCKTDFVMAKIDDFLKEIDLFELYDHDSNNVTAMIEHQFAFSTIEAVISQKREDSMSFLRRACRVNERE